MASGGWFSDLLAFPRLPTNLEFEPSCSVAELRFIVSACGMPGPLGLRPRAESNYPKDRDLNSSSGHRKAAPGKVLLLEIIEESLFEFLSMVEFRSCFSGPSGWPESRSSNVRRLLVRRDLLNFATDPKCISKLVHLLRFLERESWTHHGDDRCKLSHNITSIVLGMSRRGSVIDPVPNRRPEHAVLNATERRPIRARVVWRKPGYVAWLYVMSCEGRPGLGKVGLSVDPVRRAFGVRRKKKTRGGSPIVEYGKQVSDAVELERKTHELLKRYRVRDEWFRCSVSTATAAILRVAEAAGESGPFKARDEWIEEQAQAVVIIWRHDRYIPTAMLPLVHQLREEAKKKSERRSRKSGRESLFAYHPPPVVAPFISRFLGFPPDEQFFRGRRAVEGQILLGNVSPLLIVRSESIKIALNLLGYYGQIRRRMKVPLW